MKKFLTCIMIFCALFSIVACSNSIKQGENNEQFVGNWVIIKQHTPNARMVMYWEFAKDGTGYITEMRLTTDDNIDIYDSPSYDTIKAFFADEETVSKILAYSYTNGYGIEINYGEKVNKFTEDRNWSFEFLDDDSFVMSYIDKDLPDGSVKYYGYRMPKSLLTTGQKENAK